MMHSQRETAVKGLTYFCEKKQIYERGWKAWLVTGLYLLGALLLEITLHLAHEVSARDWKWAVCIAYLILFPVVARWLLRRLPPG